MREQDDVAENAEIKNNSQHIQDGRKRACYHKMFPNAVQTAKCSRKLFKQSNKPG